MGCRASDPAAPVCTLLVGQTSRCTSLAITASTKWERAGSPIASAKCTPCPMRRAPSCTASSTRSAASASPACSVSGRPASRARDSAWACSVAGKPSSAPARSKPITPRPCQRIASRTARSVSEGGSSRIEQTIRPLVKALLDRPSSSAWTAASPLTPCGSNNSGAMRNSASTAPSARASSAASNPTRANARGVAIACTVNAKPSRYTARLPACAWRWNQASTPAASSAGKGRPRIFSSSISVATRKPPSR